MNVASMDSLPPVREASRHKCLIYEGHASEQLPVIVPLLAGALHENRRCLYLGSPEMVLRVRTALSGSGVDVPRETVRGALVFSSDRGHLEGGGFDPAAMVGMLRGLVGDAVRDGYAGLFATGDMRWELGEDRNFERLREYEALLEQAFVDLPLAGVCQYHRDTVPPDALQAALLTHRSAYVGRSLHADNLFYIPPDLLLADGPESRDRLSEWMWRQVTRIVHAEQERDRSLKALSELNAVLERRVEQRTEELESFAYTVSHDLRAPLRAIMGYCREILEGPARRLDEDGRHDFERVVSAAQRMSQLIDALLELSRLSREKVSAAPVDLSRLALSVLDDLRKTEPGRAAEVVVETGLVARGDPRLLASALSNLLGNAWKFTARVPRARIEFGARARDGRLAYFVRDNGAGFDMSYAHKLFKPFHRLHTVSQFPGNGVGLASVQRIVARHGGEVWAEAVPGKGATFYFTLPEQAPTAS